MEGVSVEFKKLFHVSQERLKSFEYLMMVMEERIKVEDVYLIGMNKVQGQLNFIKENDPLAFEFSALKVDISQRAGHNSQFIEKMKSELDENKNIFKKNSEALKEAESFLRDLDKEFKIRAQNLDKSKEKLTLVSKELEDFSLCYSLILTDVAKSNPKLKEKKKQVIGKVQDTLKLREEVERNYKRDVECMDSFVIEQNQLMKGKYLELVEQQNNLKDGVHDLIRRQLIFEVNQIRNVQYDLDGVIRQVDSRQETSPLINELQQIMSNPHKALHYKSFFSAYSQDILNQVAKDYEGTDLLDNKEEHKQKEVQSAMEIELQEGQKDRGQLHAFENDKMNTHPDYLSSEEIHQIQHYFKQSILDNQDNLNLIQDLKLRESCQYLRHSVHLGKGDCSDLDVLNIDITLLLQEITKRYYNKRQLSGKRATSLSKSYEQNSRSSTYNDKNEVSNEQGFQIPKEQDQQTQGKEVIIQENIMPKALEMSIKQESDQFPDNTKQSNSFEKEQQPKEIPDKAEAEEIPDKAEAQEIPDKTEAQEIPCDQIREQPKDECQLDVNIQDLSKISIEAKYIQEPIVVEEQISQSPLISKGESEKSQHNEKDDVKVDITDMYVSSPPLYFDFEDEQNQQIFLLFLENFRQTGKNQVNVEQNNQLICECFRYMDAINGKKDVVQIMKFMPLTFSIFRLLSDSKVYIQERLKNHMIWTSSDLWETLIFRSIRADLSKLNEENATDEIVYQNTVHSNLSTVGLNMLKFRSTKQNTKNILQKLATYYGLQSSLIQELLMFIESQGQNEKCLTFIKNNSYNPMTNTSKSRIITFGAQNLNATSNNNKTAINQTANIIPVVKPLPPSDSITEQQVILPKVNEPKTNSLTNSSYNGATNNTPFSNNVKNIPPTQEIKPAVPEKTSFPKTLQTFSVEQSPLTNQTQKHQDHNISQKSKANSKLFGISNMINFALNSKQS